MEKLTNSLYLNQVKKTIYHNTPNQAKRPSLSVFVCATSFDFLTLNYHLYSSYYL